MAGDLNRLTLGNPANGWLFSPTFYRRRRLVSDRRRTRRWVGGMAGRPFGLSISCFQPAKNENHDNEQYQPAPPVHSAVLIFTNVHFCRASSRRGATVTHQKTKRKLEPSICGAQQALRQAWYAALVPASRLGPEISQLLLTETNGVTACEHL